MIGAARRKIDTKLKEVIRGGPSNMLRGPKKLSREVTGTSNKCKESTHSQYESPLVSKIKRRQARG